MKVASGLAIGREANPNLAAQAVKQAMQAADISIASSALLFLTSEFARDPVPALRAGGVAVFIGAGGPMGQMHVQRALELPDGPQVVIATEISDDRLK